MPQWSHGEPEQITSDGGSQPRWSAVADFIAYVSEGDLMLIPYDDRKTRTLFRGLETPESPKYESIAWSPDGKTVYSQAQDERGVIGIWAVPVEGGEVESNVWIMDLIAEE